jgi:hypothetical protein
MAKKTKNKSVTKTEMPKNTQLVVQEFNITSIDRSRKDIGDFKNSLQSAESIHYPNRVRLYDLYEDTMIDGQVTGVIEKRIEAVLNKSLHFDKGEQRVDEMDALIESEPFREVIKKIMESQGWGLSGLEFIPGKEFGFKEIPRKHIKIHKKVLANDQNADEGISYDGVSNIWVIGKEKDLGYLLKCSLYALYKRGGIAEYAQYIELFGQPVRVIYYDAYDTKTKSELRKVLDESGSSLAMMIPKQAQFEMKDGKQSNANGDLQLKFLGFCDDEISVIVLGNTETTKSSSSSGYAQSKEHGKQQLEKTKSDLKFVINLLNSPQFIAILKSYGYPVDGGKFTFEKEIDQNALKTKAETDAIVMKAFPKLPVDDDYVYSTYGIPKPKNYEAMKAKMEAAAEVIEPEEEEDVDPDKKPVKKLDKKKDKPADKKPVKKNLKAANFWQYLRSELADFFDPAP